MATTRNLKITLVYDDATKRSYTFNGIDGQGAMGAKFKIIALNESLKAGTATSFANTFVSNNGAPCIMINEAKVILTEQEVIYSAS